MAVCVLLGIMVAVKKTKSYTYVKLIGIYIAVGSSTALLLSIYGFSR